MNAKPITATRITTMMMIIVMKPLCSELLFFITYSIHPYHALHKRFEGAILMTIGGIMDENNGTNDVSNEDLVSAGDSLVAEQVERTEVSPNPHTEQSAEKPQKQKRPPFKHKKLVLLLVATAIVFGGASAGATYFIVKKDKTVENSSSDTAYDPNTSTIQSTAQEVVEQAGSLASSYTWLETPKQVDKLPLFKIPETTSEFDTSAQTVASMEYYKLGDGNDGSEVYAVAGPEELGGRPYIIVSKKGAVYSVIKANSGSYFYAPTEGAPTQYFGPELLSGVTVDPSSSISDMKPPTEITFNGQKFTTTYPGSTTAPYLEFRNKLPEQSEYVNYQKAGTVAEGTVYENISKDDPTYRVSRFELRIKPALYLSLHLKGELSDQEIDPITWNDGSANSVNYVSAGRGCGAGMSNEIAKYGKDQLVQIGKSTKGQLIYGFKSNSNALLMKHHEEYIDDSKNIDQWINGDESVYKKANFGLAIDQYVALRPLYIVEDGMGRMLVFSRQDLVLVGGCAKPVVYAYPTVPTLINVSVGADVTVSDPFYGNGWNNVMAMPNGLLGYNGKQYDSLFWEGFGNGTYPEITKGTVVPRSEADSTIVLQLRAQGLNAKEIADFTDFWLPKVPNTPFVRLSWIGTHDMNKLAPLYVSPTPDTVIRVFLDMEGLQTEQKIQPQVLHALPRTGFTVVEWGGLVTDGSVPLLR